MSAEQPFNHKSIGAMLKQQLGRPPTAAYISSPREHSERKSTSLQQQLRCLFFN